MLRTLKALCVLLKILMLLALTTITFSSEDLEDLENLEAPVISSFKIIDVRDYMSSNIESVQDHFDSETVRNEVAFQEDITPSHLESIPSEPTFPRAFIEFGDRLNRKDIFVTFRWKQPKLTNGTIQKYRVHYWLIENLKRIQTSVDIIPAEILQHKVYDLKPDTMYYFKVQAHNEVGAGPYTKFINVSTTHENPVPLLLVNWMRYIHVLDVDSQIGFKLNEYKNDYRKIIYSALEHKIYGITITSKLITLDFNPSAIQTKSNYTTIANLKGTVYDLCIDWVTRNLYWMEMSNMKAKIMKLDLTLWQMNIVKYDHILGPKMRQELNHLNVLPSTRYFYWLNNTSDNQFIIMQSNINEKNITPFLKNEDNDCFCSFKQFEQTYMRIDNTNIDKPLIYWISNDSLFAADINGSKCNLILSAGNETYFDDLTIDKINIYLYSSSKQLIYVFKKKYAFLENKEKAFQHVKKIHIFLTKTKIFKALSLDKSLQPYPPTICLTPNMKDYHVEKDKITANSINVSLPEPIPNVGCEKYNLATTIYTISISYLTCLDNEKIKKFNVQTYERYYEFQNLTQFTEYTLKLALSNFYVDKLSMGLLFGADVKLSTAGKLNAPENVTVQVLTPTLVAVYWMPPKKLNCVTVNYEVHWELVLDVLLPNSTRKITSQYDKINQPERMVDGKFLATIQPLLPGQKYLIYVRVYPTKFSNSFTDSLSNIIHMYPEPNNLILSGVSTNGINISWIPSVNLTIRYILEYKNVAMQKWQKVNNTEKNNDRVTYYIENLLPRTLYKFHLILKYPEYKRDFIWPPDERFTFETLGNVPSAPGKPTVTRLQNFVYQLNWEHAQAHDSQKTLYRLKGLIVENNYKKGSQTDKNELWNLYYNGTNNYWIITRDLNQKYRFRVQAENAYGCGEWSESSAIIDLTESIEISAMQYYLPVILSLIVIIIFCNVYYFYCLYRQRKKINEEVLPPIMTNVELATLSEMPSGNIHFNLLYAPKVHYNPNKSALIRIEKKQITYGKFLGKGHFAKVFQGTVKDLEGSVRKPVAIKMLRENASSQEKKKFLQEAKLMNQLRHKHVLRLLGICLDADSLWLILELLEADLQKYLIESRTLQPTDSHALRLHDLLAMCEDVARGCCYLEKQHFVHRDLACRNCLISARNRENRIVKIGDFGLARDIYKDDYYRIPIGEDPLPVRWMAPESLMDGIFTSQSDVWAFGVLMWEITSLGQQPYPAKNNSEISQYVHAGGRLPKPLNCPLKLYQLMLNCWNTVNDRPNFISCLENIITLRDNIEDAVLNLVDPIKRTEVNRS